MSESPYSPPSAELRDAPQPSGGSVAKALGFGFVVDMGATIVLGGILGFAWAMQTGADLAAPDAELEFATSSGYGLLSLLVGAACTGAGGYVAARVYDRGSLRMGTYFAILMTLVGLVAGGLMAGYPVWYIVLSYLGTPVAAIGGALLWKPTAAALSEAP